MRHQARLPLHDTVRLASTGLTELRALATDAADLSKFDSLVPTIAELDEVALLTLIGLFIADERVHQAFRTGHIYGFGR